MQAVSFQIVTFIAMSNHAAIRRIKKISTFLAAPSRMVLLDKPPSSVFGDYPANPQRRPVATSTATNIRRAVMASVHPP